MKVGDLVTWESLEDPPFGDDECKFGVVVEYDGEEDSATGTLPASAWVKWNGSYSWTVVFEDQVSIISESSP